MAKIDTYSCDICGAQKKETNHWFMGEADHNPGVLIKPWNDYDAKYTATTHLCGIECACKFLARELAK